jgi:hypothetical protein
MVRTRRSGRRHQSSCSTGPRGFYPPAPPWCRALRERFVRTAHTRLYSQRHQPRRARWFERCGGTHTVRTRRSGRRRQSSCSAGRVGRPALPFPGVAARRPGRQLDLSRSSRRSRGPAEESRWTPARAATTGTRGFRRNRRRQRRPPVGRGRCWRSPGRGGSRGAARAQGAPSERREGRRRAAPAAQGTEPERRIRAGRPIAEARSGIAPPQALPDVAAAPAFARAGRPRDPPLPPRPREGRGRCLGARIIVQEAVWLVSAEKEDRG